MIDRALTRHLLRARRPRPVDLDALDRGLIEVGIQASRAAARTDMILALMREQVGTHSQRPHLTLVGTDGPGGAS